MNGTFTCVHNKYMGGGTETGKRAGLLLSGFLLKSKAIIYHKKKPVGPILTLFLSNLPERFTL